MTEFRFCIGSADALRSTVWKIFSGSKIKSDVYIQSRMMGNEMKISLHESGLCQFSMTDDWIKKYSKQNSERHIEHWQRQEPTSTYVSLLFKIIIPESELRIINNNEKLQKVTWIEPPKPGYAAIIECFLTPSLCEENIKDISFPHPCLVYFQLSNKYWFVSLLHEEQITDENLQILENAHQIINQRARKFGININSQMRAGIGTYEKVKDIHGLIEIAPLPRTN